MKKIGMLKNDKMGSYELEKGYASYKTVIDRLIGDIVLCNNIVNIDESVYENISYDFEEDDYTEIYQWYLCNISDDAKEELEKTDIILSYSNKLDCDILCVDHFGTSWDYVLTDVKLFDAYEELEAYERSQE